MKVFFATPAYDGRVDAFFTAALIQSMDLLRQVPIESVWFPSCGCCYLPTVRNHLVDEFLTTDCTDLVFLDADLYWEPAGILKILKPDLDVVGGVYPKKADTEQYPVWIKTQGEPPTPRGRLVDGEPMIECWGLPTGFLRIRRRVFDVMRERELAPEVVEHDDQGRETRRFHAYFDTGFLEPDNPTKWWGEDLWFCWKWVKCGGQCWAVPDIDFHHVGMKAWAGNYDGYLRRLPGGSHDGNGTKDADAWREVL